MYAAAVRDTVKSAQLLAEVEQKHVSALSDLVEIAQSERDRIRASLRNDLDDIRASAPRPCWWEERER